MAQLMLLCRIGTQRYALETTNIIEIVHRVELSQGKDLPPAVTGQFNYHGKIVPVVDLSLLFGDRPSRPALGTRIILMKWTSGSSSYSQIVGLLVENVTETLERNQFEYAATDHPIADLGQATQNGHPLTCIRETSCIGETLLYKNEIVQCLHPEKLWARLVINNPPAATQTSGSTEATVSPTELNAATTG